MKQNRMTEYHQKILQYIQSNEQASKQDFESATKYMRQSTVKFLRGHIRFNAIPKVFDKVAYNHIKESMSVLYSILDKVISQYLIDPKFRELFEFSKELEQLILLDSGYGCQLPLARFDLFLNERSLDFKFCELNADGASAMNEDRELNNAWMDSSIFKNCFDGDKVTRFELFDSWVISLDNLYCEYLISKKLQRPQKPVLAIVDFLEIGTKSEFEVFRQAFEKFGFDAIIVDIRKLKFDGKRLVDEQGKVIDVIYRRAVTSECMQKLDEIEQFVKGVKSGAVCLVGHFRTQVIHDKNLFRILRLPYTKSLLSDVQNKFVDEHVPFTTRLNKGEFDYDEVIANKDKWLIKPADRYGSQGVATGGDYSRDEFKKIVDSHIDSDYVLQEYCTPFKTTNVYYDDSGVCHIGEYNNMTGVFYYAGKFAGLYARQTQKRVTTREDEGRVTHSVLVEV